MIGNVLGTRDVARNEKFKVFALMEPTIVGKKRQIIITSRNS